MATLETFMSPTLAVPSLLRKMLADLMSLCMMFKSCTAFSPYSILHDQNYLFPYLNQDLPDIVLLKVAILDLGRPLDSLEQVAIIG